MNPTLVTILTFAAGALAAGGLLVLLSDLVLRDRERLSQRLAEAFQAPPGSPSRKSAIFRDLGLMAEKAGPVQPSLGMRLANLLEQSGLQFSTKQFLAVSVALCIATMALLGLVTANAWIAAVGALGMLSVPLAAVWWFRSRRVQRFQQQLPEAFEMIARSVRAGQTIPAAMQLVAQDMKAPLGEEFGRFCEQQNLGLPFDVALRDLGRRCGVMELSMFVITFLVQRRSGGNPVDVLDNLSQVVRKRLLLQRKVKAVTGEGRMQALVLLILPPLMFGAILLANYTYAGELLDRPLLLIGVLIWQMIGMLWIRKIVNFDY